MKELGTVSSIKTGKPGYWELVASGDPFRLLFPLGAILGILGVSLWPWYVFGQGAWYPGQTHARIMTQGFLAAFATGFLGTALPRALQVPRLLLGEILTVAAGLSLVVGLQLSRQMLYGDTAFLVVMIFFLSRVILRLPTRVGNPPPGFVLVGMGMLCALVGTSILILAQSGLLDVPGWVARLGLLFLYQGFLLLPVMGIGAFLLPRFFQNAEERDFPMSRELPPGWGTGAALALACGVAILASFFLEARGETRWGATLRTVAIVAYFVREVPFFQKSWGRCTLGWGMRVALTSVPLGYLLIALWPGWALSFLHVVYISGFSLLVFFVASRVVLGHCGREQMIFAPLRWLLIVSVLLAIAVFTRVSTDWMPALRMRHYAYAAITWAIGAFLWFAYVVPLLRHPEEEG